MKILEKIRGKEGEGEKEYLTGFQGKFGLAVFLAASFVMFLFFYNHSSDAFTGISGEKEPSKELPLEPGVLVEQEFPGEDIALMGISIRFRTYKNSGSESVHVCLYEDGQLLEEWSVAVKELENNTYRSFPFHVLRKMSQGSSYQLSVRAEGGGERAASIWLAKDSGGGCSVDGKGLGQYALCWQMTYVALSLKMWVRLITAILFLAVGLMVILRKVNETALMSGLLVVLGVVYFWMCPLGMAPDERNHFLRAYEVSCGGWTSQHLGKEGVGGNYLPAALDEFQDPAAEIDKEDITELHYGNTALYAPVSYLPQSVGIGVARMITGNVSVIFYAGRFGNFLASMLLCLWAISLMPFGKRVLFLVMAFPMSLQEMASMAPDGFTIALSMAFFAYIFRLQCKEGKVGKKDLALIGFMGIVIALCKIVYVVLLLLVFLLPKEKFENKKDAALLQFGIPGAALAMNLVWLKISAGYLVEFMPGVSSGEQVKYVLAHLPAYCMVVVRTIQAWGVDWVMSLIGSSLGALDVRVSNMVWMVFLVMFVYEVCNCRKMGWKVRKSDWVVLVLTFLSGSALICTSIYVQWTAVASPMVSGIQGRYFTPLLPCLALSVVCACHIREQRLWEAKIYQVYGSYFYMLLLMLHGITVLDVIHHYV